MIFTCPLLAVEDMAVSRAFYENVLDQRVILDFGENITFEGRFSLQTRKSWAGFIDKSESEISQNSNNFELYFEEDDFDAFMGKLSARPGIIYVHGERQFPWGQRAVRFYDPDGYIIEVGESMKSVILRFYQQGLSTEEIADRTQHPLEYVIDCIRAIT